MLQVKTALWVSSSASRNKHFPAYMHYRKNFRPVFQIHSADHSEGLAARPAAGVEGNCFVFQGSQEHQQTRMLLDCFVAQSRQSCERWIWSISGLLITLGLTDQFAANREYVRFHLIDRLDSLQHGSSVWHPCNHTNIHEGVLYLHVRLQYVQLVRKQDIRDSLKSGHGPLHDPLRNSLVFNASSGNL